MQKISSISLFSDKLEATVVPGTVFRSKHPNKYFVCKATFSTYTKKNMDNGDIKLQMILGENEVLSYPCFFFKLPQWC